MEKKTPNEIALERIEKVLRTGSTILDLSVLNLTNLPVEIEQLTKLTSLNLAVNKITVLPAEIGQLTNLTSLNLSYNLLTALPAEIGQLTKLISLKIIQNNLTALPVEIGQLISLALLDLSYNKLTSLLAEIGQLMSLASLNLSTNNIFTLPAQIEKLTHLTTLSLHGNNLTIFPIETCQLRNLTSLNFGFNRLTVLPAEIGQLRNLTSLDLGNNQLTVLPAEIWQLINLTNLHLGNNPLNALPADIRNLTNLTQLTLYSDRLTTLPAEIGQLHNLRQLDLRNNQITALPAEIGHISRLTQIFLSENKLESLPAELWQLNKLIDLSLQKNQLTAISPEIVKLTNLEELGLSHNSLTAIPVEIQNLKTLKSLYLHDNALNIPPEILERAREPQTILNYYFSHRTKVLNEIKVILIGQGSVGKTSLVHRIMRNAFYISQTKTEGISISKWQVGDHSEIRLNLWDFGGQEIMHATHQFFLTKRSLYLLVLDSRLTQEENRVEYWLKIIQSFGGESPVLIVGNKIDQHPLDIDRTGLQKKYPNIVGILETSAATGAGIEELKAAIAEQVNNLPHVRDLLPETWFTVKTKLEELGRQSNFITHDKYVELCAENEVSDETSQRTLIGFLHDLGVVLHFQDDPRLEALGILNPQWVTNGVYKILNSHTLFQNKGVLTLAMLDEILNLPEYPRGKRLFIVDMMKKFELCYDIEPDKTFLVPDLLPKDEPAELKFNGVPAFEYAYPVLPSSVITRFIVRMNQKIDDGFVWRTGVVLKIGENKALVKADIEDRKITIAIDGLEHTRRDALSAIRYQLDEIHGSIKGLDAQKRVPIPNAPNAEPLEYETLLMLESENQEEYLVRDGKRLVKVNVRQVLSGIESETDRKESGSRITNIYIGGDVKDSNILAGDENEVKK